MQQVISYFNETLNDTNKWERTQLYEATRESDVDSVRFLVQQGGIWLDKLSKSSVEEEDEYDQLYETPLNCAVIFHETSKGIQIIELLREAGGDAWETSRRMLAGE